MKFELKSIKHSPTLSDDSEAFTCNLYINGKKVGHAKDDGNGGCINLWIDKEHMPTVHANARQWLDILDPNPIDYSKPWPKQGEDHARLSAQDRKSESPVEYLRQCVGILLSNHLVLKDVKKVQSTTSLLTSKCQQGEYVRIRRKPALLSAAEKQSIESDECFEQWLFDKDPQYIADKLGHRKAGDGPLISAVEV